MEQLEGFLHQARTKVENVNYKEDNSNLIDYSCIDAQMLRITEMDELAGRALASVSHLTFTQDDDSALDTLLRHGL